MITSLDEPNVNFRDSSRGAAESFLNDARPGTYLVRPSSKPGCLSLSYRRTVSKEHASRVTHLLLIKTSKGWCKEDDQGKFFDNVYDLLKWLSRSLFLLLDERVDNDGDKDAILEEEEEEEQSGKRTVILKPWRLFGDQKILVPKGKLPNLVEPVTSAAMRVEAGENIAKTSASTLPASVVTAISELNMRKKALVGNVEMVENDLKANPDDAQQKEVLTMLRTEVDKLDAEIDKHEKEYADPQKLLGSLEIKLQMVDDAYADEFLQKPHMNFIGQTKDREGSDFLHEIVAVLRENDNGVYRGLRIHRKGTTPISIPDNDLRADKKRDLYVAVCNYLTETLNPDGDYYYVHNLEKFSKDLSRIEEKHSQSRSVAKMAVIYSTLDKPTGKDIHQGSEAFQTFLDTIGRKLSLKGWTGYRGDMGKSNEDDTYYAKWKGVDTIFHVSTMLSADAHRRLIGNDIAIVFFRDAGLRPLHLDEIDIGTVPQVHAVVQPVSKELCDEPAYHINFFSRNGVRDFEPTLPEKICFRPKEMRDMMLCKMINGLVSAMIYSAPMNRLWYRPRGAAIEDLVKKYPKETDKAAKQRAKAEVVARKKMRETHAGLPRQLVVHLKMARNFAERDTAPSAYCVVTMQEQQYKSDVVRKAHLPMWNAEFRFDLVGVEVDLSVVQFAVWDKGVLKDDFLGQCSMPVGEALKRAKSEVVMPLQPRPGQASDLLVGGELIVRFEAEMAELHMDGEVDLTQFDWYHGNLSGADAYHLLEKHAPGSFLVRTSAKRAGCFVITYKRPSHEIIHVLLQKREDAWHAEGMATGFPSLSAVLRKYSKAYCIPISNGGKWQTIAR